MRKFILLGLFVTLIMSCNSVKKYNQQISALHPVEALQNDVDKLYKQLQKHHPKLYQYTSKSDLDFKFDSLKKSINQPLTSLEFYKKVAPVVTNVRQGHVAVGYTVIKFTKKERKTLKKKKLEFYDLDFEYLESKLWVKDNFGKDSALVGAEVVSIADEPISKLIEIYKTRFASDGYNKTLHDRFVSKGFSVFYTRDKGFLDSLKVTFRNKDSLFIKTFRRLLKEEIKNDSLILNEEKIIPEKLSKEEKKTNRISRRKKKKDDIKYGLIKKNVYARNFDFIGKDSTVACMKIRTFTNGNYKKFYQESFTKLDSANTKHLIIDLRDNGGGRIAEIDKFYSYLTKDDYQFITDSEVNSRIPFLKSFMSNTSPNSLKVVAGILSPIMIIHNLFKIRKKEGKLYYRFNKNTKMKTPNPLNFKGDIYVLINGNSFSASSLISTHLKANKRAVFVGEETGGAYNGTVAGIYKVYQLPVSKLVVRMGLMQIEAPQKQFPDGFGIKPDIEMLPTVKDRRKNIDTELEWVLNDIYKSE